MMFTGTRSTTARYVIAQRFDPDPNKPGFYAPVYFVGQPNCTAYPTVDEQDLPAFWIPL